MRKQLFISALMFLMIANMVLGLVCQSYSTTTYTDGGSDYFGVNTAVANTTTMGADQVFGSYTAFTPRLNFTKVVNETVVGVGVNANVTLKWLKSEFGYNATNATLVVTNATGFTLTNPGNYTLHNTSTTWYLNFNNANWSGQNLSVVFNRTFVKNVDDFASAPSSVYTGATTASFLTIVSTSNYGDSATFKLNSVLQGGFVNNTNYAVTWSYTNRTCINYNIDAATQTGISSTKSMVYAGLALVAVMILCAIAWGLIQIFKGGTVDYMTVAVAAIGGAIIVMLGYIIIYYIGLGLGAV